jgi:hypothetical protein
VIEENGKSKRRAVPGPKSTTVEIVPIYKRSVFGTGKCSCFTCIVFFADLCIYFEQSSASPQKAMYTSFVTTIIQPTLPLAPQYETNRPMEPLGLE